MGVDQKQITERITWNNKKKQQKTENGQMDFIFVTLNRILKHLIYKHKANL